MSKPVSIQWFWTNGFILLNPGSNSTAKKIGDIDGARTNMGASRIGAMVAEEVQNQETQDKYVTILRQNLTPLSQTIHEALLNQQ